MRERYQKYLQGVPGITLQKTKQNVVHVHWMNGILVDPARYGHTREELILHLKENNIDSRLFFIGMHHQASLLRYGCDGSGQYPVSDYLGANGFYLPSGSGLTEEQIGEICTVIKKFRK